MDRALFAAWSVRGTVSRWSEANERFHAEEAAWRDVQPATARCAFCGYQVKGVAGEVREAFLEHRLTAHPETKDYRRKRPTRQLGNFRPALMAEHERDEIESDRIRRAFLNGVEIE